MANPLRIANKSKLIEEKSRLLFTELKRQYDRGEIKTPTELAYKLYIALEDLFTKLGKPSMQKRPAWGPPMSHEYNDMMNEIYLDLKTLFSESKSMSAAITESFQQVEIERQGLTWEVNSIKDKLKGIEVKMQQKKSEVIFRESFLDNKSFDVSMVEDEPSTINASEGVLSLAKIDAEEYRKNVSVRILEGNGYLGNTHQVRALNGAYKFYGEEDVNIDLLNLVDGNADTWVEYEIFTLPSDTKNTTYGYGFNYKEGLSWVKEDNQALKLYIEIELPIEKTVNWFSLSPFIPSDKGATPPIIHSVMIHDGKGGTTEVSGGYDIMQEDQVYIFPRQTCKKIVIKVEQPSSYETLVGHFFFKELESATTSHLGKDRELSGRRIDGDMPSIESLGYSYDPTIRDILQPVRTDGIDEALNDARIKTELFTAPLAPERVQSGLEAVSAKRFAIGLRDLSISSYRFSASSEFVSTSYTSADEITSIKLNVTEDIPEEFGDGVWISYQITVDEGKTWHTIHPAGTSSEGAQIKYLINQQIPQEGRFDNIGYIDTIDPVKSVRLKIIMRRPIGIVNADYYTPLVKDYQVRCETEKGATT